MKIIYNCTALEKWEQSGKRDTGIQRVMRELGKELISISTNIVPVVFDPDGSCFSYNLTGESDRKAITVSPGDFILSAGHDWDYLNCFQSIFKYLEIGVHLCVFIYDIVPIDLPFTYADSFVERFRIWLHAAFEKADCAFVISENTYRNIKRYATNHTLSIPEIFLLRLGDNFPSKAKTMTSKLRKKVSNPFILSVGTIEYRKNHITLLNAYRILIQEKKFTPPMLYIVGNPGSLDGNVLEQINGDIRLAGRIEILQDICDTDLNALYEEALFTVYPSIYEGWGLPVAESLYHGKQCITSNCSSMLEIAPSLTRFSHPLCPDQWAKHIYELSSDTTLLIKENYRIQNEYVPVKWNQVAKNVLAKLFNKRFIPSY